MWIAPTQVSIISLSDSEVDYAKDLAKSLRQKGLRVVTDFGNDRIGAKIRKAEVQKIPYMCVIGKREVEQSKVSLRKHRKGDVGSFTIDEVTEMLVKEVEEKKTDL